MSLRFQWWGISGLVSVMTAMGLIQKTLAFLNEQGPVEQGLAVAFISFLGVVLLRVLYVGFRWIRPTSKHREWMDLASRFYRLAEQDHITFPPGVPVPGGLRKVVASRLFGKWRLDHGTEPHIRHEAEALCRMAGKLLRRSNVAHKRVWPWSDPVQDWLTFVESLNIGERREMQGVDRYGVVTEASIILDVVIFSCFLAAKHCASFETIPVGE